MLVVEKLFHIKFIDNVVWIAALVFSDWFQNFAIGQKRKICYHKFNTVKHKFNIDHVCQDIIKKIFWINETFYESKFEIRTKTFI